MIVEGARLKDRYRLERLLGRGGMAAVWLADDLVLDRPVAVKVLSDTIASDPEFLARFRREARIAAGLSHPNLIGVYDYAEGDERPYLVMEYVPGETLAERMSRKAEIDCRQLARELLGALTHIHEVGIVHRDIKPQNVLIAPDGSAKLIDFGIALPKDATALTRTGHLLGTARYIAPEVMAGGPATERSDLFSCGVLLRDCLGDHPPRRLRGPVARLCDENPRARPASAREALAQIERKTGVPEQPTQPFTPTHSRPAPTAATETSTRRLAPERRRSSRGRAIAVLAILAAAAVAFLLVTEGGGDQPREARGGQAHAGREETNAARPQKSNASAPSPAPVETDPASGSALNDEGFELIQAGSYEEAVPVLEEAVRAFPPGSDDLNYAYALFNLGNALRLSGRPEEAIPILEQRLAIPNQTEAVRSELEAAEREAGVSND